MAKRQQKVDYVAATSTAYEAQRKDWQLVTDLLGGTRRMRANGTKYLPQEPLEDKKAYQLRLRRSFLYNMFKMALQIIVNQPFAKEVKVKGLEDLPEDYRVEGNQLPWNVDGAGTEITEFASDLYESMVALGHVFGFVDYTDVRSIVGDREFSKADEDLIKPRPIFKLIKACDMLGHRFEKINGVNTLTMIKFREVRVEPLGDWTDEEREYIHVWRAPTGISTTDNPKGKGTYQIWQASMPTELDDPILGEYLGTRPFVDRSSKGSGGVRSGSQGGWSLVKEGFHSFPGIPIIDMYANRKADFISTPPLIELAWTNLEHFQSLSDQRNILRFARLAQKVISGANTDDEKDPLNLKASVHNVMILKSPEAKAYYLEHSGAGIQAGERDLESIEERGEAQGARPTQARTLDSTATGAMINLIHVTSDSQAWVMVTEIGLRKMFEVAARWREAEKPEEYKVGDKFGIEIDADFTRRITSEDFVHVADLAARGRITHKTELEEAQRRGILSDSMDIEVELEEVGDEIEVKPIDDPDEDQDVDVDLKDNDPNEEEEEKEEKENDA